DSVALETQDRILCLTVCRSERVAVLPRIPLVMAAEAVGQALEEERPVARARPGEIPAECPPHRHRVAAVDTLPRDGGGSDDIAHALDGRVCRPRRELREAVVLAGENER